MQFRSAAVQNFRCIRESQSVDLEDDITTLLGKNGSGKTSFLHAVRSIRNDDSYAETDLPRGSRGEDVPIVRIELRTESGDEIVEHVPGLSEETTVRIEKYADGERKVAEDWMPSDYRRESVFDQVRAAKREIGDLLVEYDGLPPDEYGRFRFTKTIAAIGECEDNLERYDTLVSEAMGSLERMTVADEIALQRKMENWLGTVDSTPDEAPTDGTVPKRGGTETARSGVEGGLELKSLDLVYSVLSQTQEQIEYARELHDADRLLPPIVYQDQLSLLSSSATVEELADDPTRPLARLLRTGGIDDPKTITTLDRRDRNNVLITAQERVQRRINRLWRQKTVSIELRYDQRHEEIELLVHDRGSDETEGMAPQPIGPENRSKGFQWFLAAYLQLAAESSSDEDGLLLFDDPAVFLHPEGKRDWLSTVEGELEEMQVVYTSHSPFLIDEGAPDRIRLLEKTDGDGTRITRELHTGANSTLEPLRRTLGLDVSSSLMIAPRKVLILEGVVDRDVLNAVIERLDETGSLPLDSTNVCLVPSGGAGEVPKMARWVANQGFDYAVLFDDDSEGRGEADTLRSDENYHAVDSDRVFCLHPDADEPGTVLEDLFHPAFYVDCLNRLYQREGYFESDKPIIVDQTEDDPDDWWIETERYRGTGLPDVLDDVFEQRESDYRKRQVGDELRRRIKAGADGFDDSLEGINATLGQLDTVL